MNPSTLALLAAALAMLAGCAGSPAGPGVPADPGDATAVHAGRAGTDCAQVHSYFKSPAEGFRAFVPQGFALATEDGAGLVVDVRVEATRCAEATEVWVELPVVPPVELARRAPDAIHTVPIAAYVDAPFLADAYRSVLPDHVFDADIALSATPGGRYSLQVAGARESYAWEGAINDDGASFGPEMVARWVPRDDRVSGHYLRVSSESTTVGFGPVSMAHQGAGGAPPVAAGIAHVVDGMTLTETFVVNA